jgi:hypothetical protein
MRIERYRIFVNDRLAFFSFNFKRANSKYLELLRKHPDKEIVFTANLSEEQ